MLELADLLVIDDDLDGADALAEILRTEGHEVRVGYNGEDGLRLARERLPDMALLDVEMPLLDGPGMAHQMFIHDMGMELVPVVLLSGAVNLRQVAATVGVPLFSRQAVPLRTDRDAREPSPLRTDAARSSPADLTAFVGVHSCGRSQFCYAILLIGNVANRIEALDAWCSRRTFSGEGHDLGPCVLQQKGGSWPSRRDAKWSASRTAAKCCGSKPSGSWHGRRRRRAVGVASFSAWPANHTEASVRAPREPPFATADRMAARAHVLGRRAVCPAGPSRVQLPNGARGPSRPRAAAAGERPPHSRRG